MAVQQTTEQRFDNLYMPVPESGCWIWIGNTNERGYGRFKFSGKTVKAHRHSYQQKHGPIPKELELDHKCRVRCCVNPAHLEAVTHQENIRRGETGKYHRKKKTHCSQGHPYSGDNLYINPNTGCRSCKSCSRRYAVNYYWRNKNGH
jgi:HNH endonuclease